MTAPESYEYAVEKIRGHSIAWPQKTGPSVRPRKHDHSLLVLDERYCH
jgi:hypothetical protein